MFNVYKYSLPFRKPFITGAGIFHHRQGLIVRFLDDESDLISEVAPLPGFSSETLRDVLEILTSNREKINSFFTQRFSITQLASFLDAFPNLPSLQFGLSSLGLLILAERSGSTFPSFLNRSVHAKIKVNAVVGSSDAGKLKQQIKELYQSGFRVIKCKVTGNPGDIPQTLSELSSDFPDLIFRLDANQTWKFSTIEQFSEQFRQLSVEYVEDPLKLTNAEQFRDLINKCKLPVAADESIVQFGLSRLITQEYIPPYFILKPMFLGNLINLFATITRSKHLDRRVIFTTSLESVVGRRIISIIATMYGSKSSAHGLHTGILFSNDLFDVNSINNGLSNVRNNQSKLITFKIIDSSKLDFVF
ncbi:hypothetical protein BH23BAC3_BH23BAC3_18410 [soil metagenome]